MKKLFALLTIGLLFIACDKNDDTPVYYNPVEGMWSFYNSEKQLVNTRVFTDEFQTYYTFFNGSVVPEADIKKQSYKIEIRTATETESKKEAIIFDKDYGRIFTIKGDTLFLENNLGATEIWIRGNKNLLN